MYFIVLARIYAPEAFGAAAVVVSVSLFGQIFTDLGIGPALIQRANLGQNHLVVGFWINAITGLLLTALIFGLSWPIANLYDNPLIGAMLRVASFVFICSLSVVPISLLERDLRFGTIWIVEGLAAAIAYGGCAIAAFLTRSPLWIVAPYACYAAVLSLILFIVAPVAPWGGKELPKAVRELRGMIGGVTGSNIIAFWSRNVDTFLLAKFGSALQLGFYSRAYSLMLAPVSQVTFALGRVLLPALARKTPRERRNIYRAPVRVVCTIIFPVATLVTGSAERISVTVFGPQWSDMGPILAVLAASIPAQVLNGTTGAVYQAAGDTRTLLSRGALLGGVTVIAILLGLPWGAMGVAIALLVRFYAAIPYTMAIPLRHVGLTANDLWKDLRMVSAAALLAGLCAAILDQLFVTYDLGALIVVEFGGALAFVVCLWCLDSSVRKTIRQKIHPVPRGAT